MAALYHKKYVLNHRRLPKK